MFTISCQYAYQMQILVWNCTFFGIKKVWKSMEFDVFVGVWTLNSCCRLYIYIYKNIYIIYISISILHCKCIMITKCYPKNCVVTQVEEICRGWYQQISLALETQQKKSPMGNGPLAEIDYWRERNAALSALYEQIKVLRECDPLIVISLLSVHFISR